MKKPSLILIACIALLTSSVSFAQIKTEGAVTEVDSATGQVKTTTYTEVKKRRRHYSPWQHDNCKPAEVLSLL